MSDPSHIGAVILAAGASSRMGRPKQLLLYEGRTFIRRAAVAALQSGCAPVIVVTGANADEITREIDGLHVAVAQNNQWESGLASSIRRGVEALVAVEPSIAAAVLLLCDQPLVTAAVITDLMSAYRMTRKPLIASSYGETAGVPALFDKCFFAELMQLGGTAGAKGLIERHSNETTRVPFAGGVVDIDTPEEYSQFTSGTS